MKKKEKTLKDERCVRKMFFNPLITSLMAAFVLAISFHLSLADENGTAAVKAPPEFIDINIQAKCPDMAGLKKDTKSVKHFSHKAHIDAIKKEGKGFVCATCHQDAKTEEDITGAERCNRIQKELEKTGGPAKLKDHFHNQCLKCHKELKKEQKPTGPTSCKGCHGRKGATK